MHEIQKFQSLVTVSKIVIESFNTLNTCFVCVRQFRYSENVELEDAVHTAILTLKEGFEGQMTQDNIEIGICDAKGFRRLSPSQVNDYLANIQ